MNNLILLTLTYFVSSTQFSNKYPSCPQISKKQINANYNDESCECLNFITNTDNTFDVYYPPLLFQQSNDWEFNYPISSDNSIDLMVFDCKVQSQMREFCRTMYKAKWNCSFTSKINNNREYTKNNINST